MPYRRWMTTPRTLTDLMAEVSSRARDWGEAQELGVERGAVVAAWLESDDPVAMLHLLVALYPKREKEKCLELATALSFFEPMRDLAHTIRRWSSGIPTNGQSPFYFMRSFQRLNNAFRWMEDTTRSDLEPKLVAAIRAAFPDPYTLVGPAASGPG
ncbi:hypothetical protein LXT21_43255 [Myxococcus sp. K38C18041901]|uniref:hypothetical protein n=1 Tax=Myxococcus guangdongensis TaxID=2906760 RepID=UPI0020A81DB5|nr:hypothetical protein [Myxococcus guangdongensis]MCP3065606.1 hypothetical protein [Myxococcus guangdongensis]